MGPDRQKKKRPRRQGGPKPPNVTTTAPPHRKPPPQAAVLNLNVSMVRPSVNYSEAERAKIVRKVAKVLGKKLGPENILTGVRVAPEHSYEEIRPGWQVRPIGIQPSTYSLSGPVKVSDVWAAAAILTDMVTMGFLAHDGKNLWWKNTGVVFGVTPEAIDVVERLVESRERFTGSDP